MTAEIIEVDLNRGARTVHRLIPRVKKRYLYFFAGLFWTIAGSILCYRGTIWLSALPSDAAGVLGATSLILATPAYLFGFSRIVKRNIDRIAGLPERAHFFSFTAARGYAMIALMMTVGISLRNSSFPKDYLIVPYYVMGGVLLAGSMRFYREFVLAPSTDYRTKIEE